MTTGSSFYFSGYLTRYGSLAFSLLTKVFKPNSTPFITLLFLVSLFN